MFDTKALLDQLETLDVTESFEAAASLHWQIEHLAYRKAVALIQRILPQAADLSADTESEYDDAGGTYLTYDGTTITFRDGTRLDLPDESQIDDGTFEDGNCGPEISAEALERIDAAVDADPNLVRLDLLLAEVGRPLGLDAAQVRQLVEASSFVARSSSGQGCTFDAKDSPTEAATPAETTA
ncbi:MAG: hypothetical protein AB7F99_20665 [Vicinamibacterales bacterium]